MSFALSSVMFSLPCTGLHLVYHDTRCYQPPASLGAPTVRFGCGAGGLPHCRFCAQALKMDDLPKPSTLTLEREVRAAFDTGCKALSGSDGIRVELTWRGHIRDFHAAISFIADTRGRYCHVNRVRKKCGGVTTLPAEIVDAATSKEATKANASVLTLIRQQARRPMPPSP